MEKWDTPQQAMPYQHSEAAFERIFKTHFKALHCYAHTFVKDNAAAEDIVQATFCRLWEKSGELEIHSSITAYLYRAVYHESLNYLKHRKVEAVHEQHSKHTGERHAENAHAQTELRELEGSLAKALTELPEGCRTVFQLSRFESLKYREIADQLGISVKTVENQMGKALRILRVKLADFLPLLIVLLLLKH